MPSRVRLAALFSLALVGAFMVPGAAGAGGAVLAPHGGPAPHTVDMRVAIAAGPSGTIRWSQVTVAGGAQALWLVPVRPGAALDWADESFLASLDDASDVRVVPELDAAPCAMPGGAERASSWTSAARVRAPLAVRVHQTESEARAHAAARGFGVSTALGARISTVYARGDALVSLELPASGGTAVRSPTLRVSDDGEAMLPFALTGDARAATRITAFVIAEGAASVPGMRDVTQSHLTWGPEGSNYAAYRRTLLATGGGDVWLRESSGHGILFDGPDADGRDAIAPFVSRYFGATTEEGAGCVEAAREARAAAGTVGRWCAPGALLRVPGGTHCVEESGDVDPAAFACGEGRGDLALALGGLHAGSATVTRLAGIVLASDLGADTTISIGAPGKERPVLVAATVAACPPEQPPTAPPGPPLEPPRPREPEVVVTPVASGGCGGGAVEIYDEGDEGYDDEGSLTWDSDDDGWDDGAGEACSGSTASSSSGYYDDDDDTDDDSCSGSSSSSSSGDSDDDGWDSDSDDDDGWDSSDDDDGWDTSSAAPKKHAKSTKSLKPKKRLSRPKSPVSRYALLFVAVLLPLRRRLRPTGPRF